MFVTFAVAPEETFKISLVVRSKIRSTPSSILKVSAPSPPVNVSFPGPPVIISDLVPPMIWSFPPFPSNEEEIFAPLIMSFEEVPFIFIISEPSSNEDAVIFVNDEEVSSISILRVEVPSFVSESKIVSPLSWLLLKVADWLTPEKFISSISSRLVTGKVEKSDEV